MIKKIIEKLGYQIQKKSDRYFPVEATNREVDTFNFVKEYTMTSPKRIWSLISATTYIIKNNIKGDFVECGVWRGGSSMAVARTLLELNDPSRVLHLYDTFEGMTEPSQFDVEATTGVQADTLLNTTPKGDGNNVWCIASKEDVSQNMAKTGYPSEKINFVMGDVSKTLQTPFPNDIALLRLDTDWYESTKIELETLFPRLVSGGVCIIDDYGHWAGARRAVDEFLVKNGLSPWMHVIDETGRAFIKP